MKNVTLFSKKSILKGFALWLLSNVGGTLLLGAHFSLERAEDFTIGLLSGLLAAVVSIVLVPFCIPFFEVVGNLCACWSRRTAALIGVVLFYSAANFLLLYFLPILTLESVVSMSFPYLLAALGAVFYLYHSAGRYSTASQHLLPAYSAQ